MNGYERYENLRTERMRAERERVFDEWLFNRLQNTTKAESLQALNGALTFIVGTADIASARMEKTPV